MKSIFLYTTVLLILQIVSQLRGQKFNGKVESYGVELMKVAGGGAINLTPPKAEIKDSNSEVEYSKTEPVLLVPPLVNQVMAMVETLHPKLDVKGPYSKWTPKIENKKLKVLHIHSPKLLPLHHNSLHKMKLQKIKAIRRSKHLGLSRGQVETERRNSLFQNRIGKNMRHAKIHQIKVQPKKMKDFIERRSKRSLYDLEFGSKERDMNGISPKPLDGEESGFYRNRISRRDVYEPDDISKNIEALIAKSLQGRKIHRNITSDSHKERSLTELQKDLRMSQRKRMIHEKIKELGNYP